MRGAPKRANSDANEVHAPKKEEIPTSIFGGIGPDKPGEPRAGETGSTVEKRRYKLRMIQETRTTVQRAEATVDDNIVAGSTVAKFTVPSPNNAIVSINKLPKFISKMFLKASHLKSAQIIKSHIKVL